MTNLDHIDRVLGNDDQPTLIDSRSLNIQVYQTLVDWLIKRKLKPEQKLTVEGLAQELSVSRSPVYHALTQLVSENLVTVSPRQGYYVVPITRELIIDGFDVRMSLELLAAEKTVGRLSEEELKKFHQLMEGTRKWVKKSEFLNKRAYLLANWAFHSYQVDLANNKMASRYYRMLGVKLLVGRVIQEREDGIGEGIKHHAQLVDAYEASDLNKAQDTIRIHIEFGKRLALEQIEAIGEPM